MRRIKFILILTITIIFSSLSNLSAEAIWYFNVAEVNVRTCVEQGAIVYFENGNMRWITPTLNSTQANKPGEHSHCKRYLHANQSYDYYPTIVTINGVSQDLLKKEYMKNWEHDVELASFDLESLLDLLRYHSWNEASWAGKFNLLDWKLYESSESKTGLSDLSITVLDDNNCNVHIAGTNKIVISNESKEPVECDFSFLYLYQEKPNQLLPESPAESTPKS